MITKSSFTKKLVQVEITLGKGEFGADLGNTVVLAGLQTECVIDKAGHPTKNCAKVKIYGMLEDDMNVLTTVKFKKALAVQKNRLQILAGDEHGMAVAFKGEITGAWANYNSPPNLFFQLEALEGFYPSIASVASKSYKGGVSVSLLMANLARQMDYVLEDNGVQVILANPHLYGTAFQQAVAIAEAADIEFGLDNGVMFISPRQKARKGEAILISADTGMRDYPVFDKKGILVETYFNPAIKLGGLVKVESRVSVANGVWRVSELSHRLDAEKPNGQWSTKFRATYVGE